MPELNFTTTHDYGKWLEIVKQKTTFDLGNVAVNYLINEWEDGADPYIIASHLNEIFDKEEEGG